MPVQSSEWRAYRSIGHTIYPFLQVRSSAHPIALILLTGIVLELCGKRNRRGLRFPLIGASRNHEAPRYAGELVYQRHGHQFRRLALQQGCHPW